MLPSLHLGEINSGIHMYQFTFAPLHFCLRVELWFRVWTKILAVQWIWRKKTMDQRICIPLFTPLLKSVASKLSLFTDRPFSKLRVTIPRLACSAKLSPVRRGSHLDGCQNTNTPCWNNFFFCFLPFWRRYQRCRTTSLEWCRFFYFSTIRSSFRHVRIHQHSCVYNIV